MLKADKKQKQLIAILTKNDRDFKRELVMQATQDPEKGSTNDLTHSQANDIIARLGGKPVV